jgi:hypothetical protein
MNGRAARKSTTRRDIASKSQRDNLLRAQQSEQA